MHEFWKKIQWKQSFHHQLTKVNCIKSNNTKKTNQVSYLCYHKIFQSQSWVALFTCFTIFLWEYFFQVLYNFCLFCSIQWALDWVCDVSRRHPTHTSTRIVNHPCQDSSKSVTFSLDCSDCEWNSHLRLCSETRKSVG